MDKFYRPLVSKLRNKNGIAELCRMHEKLKTYAELVRKKIPGVYFLHTQNNISEDGCKTVYVAVHGYPFILGSIYVTRSYARNNFGSYVYGLRSDTIKNQRGPEMDKETKNLGNAVKLAAKHLVKIPYQEALSDHVGKLHAAREEALAEKPNKYRRGMYDMFGYGYNRDIADFVLDCVKNKVPNIPSKYRDKLEELVTLRDHVSGIARQKPNMDAVLVLRDAKYNPHQFVIVPLVDKEPDSPIGEFYIDKNKHVEVCSTLPEDIESAIHMLHMVEDGTYLDGFGVTAHREDLYYVERAD